MAINKLYSYEDRKNHIRELDTEAALTMIYMWVKQSAIGKAQYMELLNVAIFGNILGKRYYENNSGQTETY